MMKAVHSVKTEHEALDVLRQLLQQIPVIERFDVQPGSPAMADEIDLVAQVVVGGRRHTLVCEVKASGQPRHVRSGLLELRDYVSQRARNATPVFIAPYLSPDAQALCREQEAGFLDFEGNVRLIFGSVFIERQVASKPVAERREIRSLFKRKSAQVLRTMLGDPQRAWRVAELAEVAGVSLGHVSNVRASLLEREWARVSGEGLFLCAPDALLDAWRDAYEPPAGKRQGFYTPLHGSAFEQAVQDLAPARRPDGSIALASFSAAQWLAPYGRTGMQYFYADPAGFAHLQEGLKLAPVLKGENVAVTVLEEPGLFRDVVEPAPGIICTSPVQTYLDLAAAGERGREAADHLRQEKLIWQN
jgi:hypothetical protein